MKFKYILLYQFIMKLIPFVGVLIFLKPLLINKSKRALIILINGMMYHGLKTYENENTKIIKILKYNDIITNMFLIIYSLYNRPQHLFYAIFGCTNFIIKEFFLHYLLKTNMHNIDYTKQRDISSIFHVLFVQIPFFIGLEKILNN